MTKFTATYRYSIALLALSTLLLVPLACGDNSGSGDGSEEASTGGTGSVPEEVEEAGDALNDAGEAIYDQLSEESAAWAEAAETQLEWAEYQIEESSVGEDLQQGATDARNELDRLLENADEATREERRALLEEIHRLAEDIADETGSESPELETSGSDSSS